MNPNQFLGIEGLADLVQELKDYISDQKVLFFSSIAEFPNTGRPDVIYINKTKNTLYRWDEDKIKYYQLAFQADDTYILDCGSSV